MKSVLDKYLSREELDRIAAAIAEAESRTSGEIRVSILYKRRWSERKLSLHDLALGEFQRLAMHKTRDRTGVLILLLLGERRFQIIADEGIHTKVAEGLWDELAARMSGHFGQGRFADGLCDVVAAVGLELERHAPRRGDDTDELPNQISERR
jgi:uncharacterized membrane protein